MNVYIGNSKNEGRRNARLEGILHDILEAGETVPVLMFDVQDIVTVVYKSAITQKLADFFVDGFVLNKPNVYDDMYLHLSHGIPHSLKNTANFSILHRYSVAVDNTLTIEAGVFGWDVLMSEEGSSWKAQDRVKDKYKIKKVK